MKFFPSGFWLKLLPQVSEKLYLEYISPCVANELATQVIIGAVMAVIIW